MGGECVQLCFSSFHFYPVHGGGQLRFMNYFQGFRKRGVQTQVFTGTPQSSKLTNEKYVHDWMRYPVGAIIPTEPVNGTPVHRVRIPENDGILRQNLYHRKLALFCQRREYTPDVVLLFQTLPDRSIYWLRQLRNRGISLAYAYTAPAKIQHSLLKRFLRRWSLHIASQLINCIIVSSLEMGDHARKIGFHGRIEVIPNGTDLKRFYPDRSDPHCQHLRASMGMNDDSIMIITVGSLIPEKGADLLLEAWTPLAKRFPNTHLVIIGARFDPDHPKKGQYQKKIASLIAACGAGDRIHLTGHVSNIDTYYRASDMFIFPTLREGMPNVVLEAMASGAPVVLTPFPTLPRDFGRSGCEYLLSERNPEALSVHMESLIRNLFLRRELGQRGRCWVEQTMDIEKTLDRYAALYRELAKRNIRR